MALEEQIVEEEVIDGGGDPEPKLSDKDRGRLDDIVKMMVRKGESSKKIKAVIADFKTKYAPKPIKAEEYKVNIAQPTFKAQPVKKEQIQELDMNRNLRKPETAVFNIGGELKPVDVGVQRTRSKAQGALDKIKTELLNNDDVLEKTIRNERGAAAERLQLEEQLGQPQSDDTVVQNPALQVDARVPRPVDPRSLPVTPQDILTEKIKMAEDPLRGRNILENIAKEKPEKKNDIQSAIYQLDIANSLDDDEASGQRVNKIEENIKKLEKGELLYNWRNGQLFKPENVAQSFVTGWKAKNKAYNDYEKFRKIENNDAIAMELDARMQNADPDEAIPVPASKISEIGGMLGQTPAKVLAAGALGSLVGPEGTIAATAGVSALESYKLGWANSFERAYYELRRNGMDGFQAVEEARKLADSSATTDAVVGGVSGLIGARMGMRAIPKGAVTEGFRNSVISSLKGMGKVISPALKEGLLAGGVGAAGEKYKNELALEAGLNVDADENVLKAAEDNLLMSLAMGALFGIGGRLTKTAGNRIRQGLSKMNPDVLEANLNRAVEDGVITQEQAAQAVSEINDVRTQDATIPQNISEEARIKISDQIKKRDALESSMQALHKSFHPRIKEQIAAIDEKINELSQEKAPKPDKAIADLKAFIEDELNEGVVKGFTAEVLRSADPDDLPGFMKDIAEQAQDPLSEATTRDTYGDGIVDKAIEMYPVKPEPVKESSISVIRPEDPKGQMATITIKPKEDAIPVRESEAAVVDETSTNSGEMGVGISQSKESAGARPKEESQNTGQEGEIRGEPIMSGITHAKMDEMSRRLGFPEYEKAPERQSEWIEQAQKRIQDDPQSIPNLMQKMRDGEIPSPVEQKMMGIYVADLEAKLSKDPFNDAIENELRRAKDLSNVVGGRMAAQSLVARQGIRPIEETLGDFYEKQQQASKVGTLTRKQKETNLKEFEDIKAAETALENKRSQLQVEQELKDAETFVNEVKRTTKKGEKKDYKKERQDIIAQMRADLLKVAKGGGGAMSSIPGAAQLAAVAPHVAKLVKSLVQEGVEKLPDIINAVHEQLKDVVEGISKDDVRKIIAGEYSQKRSRNEITAKLRDIKDEARLVGKLLDLLAGIEPKTERERIKRNQEIEDLKQQIKDHNLTNLAAAKSRMNKEIQDLESKLAAGDYAKTEKRELSLDKEGQKLKEKLIQLRKEREIRLAQEEFENRPNWKKALDMALIPVRELRTLNASFDYSMPLRQGLVPTAAELLTSPGTTKQRMVDMIRASGSEKFFDNYMYDLKNSDSYPIMEKSGLAITEPGKFSTKEEVFQSKYLEKVPVVGHGIKASERAAAFWLNDQRTNIFMEGVRRMQENGRTFENSEDAYKKWASFVNSITGKGELVGPFKNASELLSTVLFSPKLMASRAAFFNPMFYAKVPKELRWKVAADMGKFLGLGIGVLSLANMFGAETEYDPRAADFGKIKVGDTRYDMWGGMQQYARIFAQTLSLSKKTAGGNEKSLWEENRKGERGLFDSWQNFFRTKLSPVAGTVWDISSGKNVVGQDVTVETELWKLMPLIVKDAIQGAQEEGWTGAAKILPSVLGVGVMSYGSDSSRAASGGSGKKNNKKDKKKSNKKD